ncbi:uncharacterized protein LOC122293561 [Carya illinoinensis]|uniref:uncharacterized protein LOC122293561 n=1 Tax=Carya illinoinensis TaxID=32201 RepID=UPI001C722CB2|nr:uncharacterized protein LOC122293561 [Carya illinoinensis]
MPKEEECFHGEQQPNGKGWFPALPDIMSLLVWNYRGLGNPRSVRILSKLVKEKGPLLVFLLETKCSKQRMEVVRRSLKMDGCFDVESVGMSGGIALLWKEEWEVQVVSYTRWHVSAMVKEEINDRRWHFTGFYGHPETAKRKSSWQLLEMLKPQSSVAWLCAGDFNEVLHQKEKQGASSRPYNQIEAFRQAVEICGLYDVHHLGQYFTWSNNRRGEDFTKERIDRAMANKEWQELFREYQTSWSLRLHNETQIGNMPKGPTAMEKKKTKQDNHKHEAETLQRISHLQNSGTGSHITEMQQLQKRVESSLAAEDVKWRQRAKQHWLRGQEYTLLPSAGLLEKKNQHRDMKSWLSKPFTREEVRGAMFQMNPLGSPGPDGFPADFYQKHWEVVGEEVYSYALEVLNCSRSLQDVNDTYISLIPRVKNPKRVAEFRPISLCNVLYKIVSKTLANRMKGILHNLISLNQSVFVPGRLISDNILVAYEVLHSMNSRMKGKRGCMALKIDMSKTYDRIEWSFVEAVMVKMEFPLRWIRLIQSCLNLVSYSILVNGEPQRKFKPLRGLRQGDLVSPYIFIMCAEALSSMLKRAEQAGQITPAPVGRGPITINHLFFADDSILFCQATSKELACVLKVLEVYGKASGQVLNKYKSSILFSKNTQTACRTQILVKATSNFEKYLGLPAVVGRQKVATFHTLIDRTWARMVNWKNKFLSSAGKEVLLKSVLQAIPSYAMGIFLLPTSITNRLNQLIRKFWWGYNEDTSKIQWVRWNQLSYSKEAGGLGFRDFRSFNLALLAKQGWRILQNPSSLAAMVLKQKYFPKTGFLDATLGARPSFAWRGVCAGLKILREGLVWRVGSGHNINIWKDWWITYFPSKRVVSTRPVGCECEKVSDLIDSDLKTWKYPFIQELLTAQEYEAVKAIPISAGGREDRMVWHFTTNGEYSVKSGYHVHRQMEADFQGESSKKTQVKHVWKSIWKLKTSPSVKQFMWRACSEALPTLANVKRRKVVEDNNCLICSQAIETSSHALWSCVAAQDVWKQSCKKVQKMSCHSDLFFDIWSLLVENLDATELEDSAVVLKRIWSRRNKMYHGKGFTHPTKLYQQAIEEVSIFRESLVIDQGTKKQAGSAGLRWAKPMQNSYKLNWDAAVRAKEGRVGIGVRVRDFQGQVVGTVRAQRPLRGTPFDAEAYGLLVAAEFSRDLGLQQVCLEGDAKWVVDGLQSKAMDWSLGGCLIEDAKRVLNSSVNWTASHVHREANMAAHQLAKVATEMVEDVSELERCPSCVFHIVHKEMM